MLALEFATVVAADLALLSAYRAGNELELHDCLIESQAILNSLAARSQVVLHANRELAESIERLSKHVNLIHSL